MTIPKTMVISKTQNHSWSINGIPKGCMLCVRGRKTVLFVTGLCSKHCFYCPISNEKWQKDVIYANEWKIEDFKDVIKEINLCSSKGVGITGGDPLMRLQRTCDFIKRLKRKFGKGFHIHLYTPLELVDAGKLKRLHDAGLDEIRFNPDLDKPELWKKVSLALDFDWDAGIEIPVIPGYLQQTKELIDLICGKVKFINLNELEISDTNCNELLKKGFVPKDELSYGVKGSQEMAMELLNYLDGKKLKVHYCTAKLKDNVQLRKRIKLRAKNYATKFDKITSEGTLKRIVVYADELKPGAGYGKKLKRLGASERKRIIGKLRKINKEVKGILDKDGLRVIIGREMITKAKKLSIVAKVEEYPTQDRMLIDVEFLN
jgi:uncharacterized protein